MWAENVESILLFTNEEKQRERARVRERERSISKMAVLFQGENEQALMSVVTNGLSEEEWH